MKFGYADNLIDKISDVDKMYNDDVRYTNNIRPNLDALLNNLKPGDVIVVKELSQLSWSIKNVIKLLTELLNKNVNIITDDNAINCLSSRSLLSSILKIENHRFGKVRKETYVSRKKIEIDQNLWNAYYLLWKNKSIRKIDWMHQMGLSQPTFYRRLREFMKQECHKC